MAVTLADLDVHTQRPAETELTVVIPGIPFAQPRPRAFVNPRTGRAAVHSSPKEQTWRKYAQDYMREAVIEAGCDEPMFPEGPLRLEVVAVFPCPASRRLKRGLRPAEWRDKLPDASNVAKAVEDAANGILWMDDRQVAALLVKKVTAEQDDPPRTQVVVRRLVGTPIGAAQWRSDE